jgi:uncharacterized membrane protein YfcA
MALPFLVLLGLGAGALTTMAGQGGGIFLLLVLGVFVGPHEALALSSPALLLGNVHRAILYRRDAAWGIAARIVAGAAPLAVVGGLLAGRTPGWLIDVVLVSLTIFAFLRASKRINVQIPQRAFPAAGGVVGLLTGTSGGAGVLVSPLLLSTGLTGKRFVGTSAIVAVAIHVGRVSAYAKTGLLRPDHLVAVAVIAASIFAGNALANRMRTYVSERACTRLEYATLAVCALLSVTGLTR